MVYQMNERTYCIPNGRILVCLLFSVGITLCVHAQVSQTFFLPLPEEELKQNFNAFGATTGNVMETVVSVTITDGNTVIYYDHWEDGYENDITNPTQATTQVWGDGNVSNGMPPGYSVDLLDPGCVISLRNGVPVPRNPTVIYYDARDKLLTDEFIVVAKANWPISPGSVLSLSLIHI